MKMTENAYALARSSRRFARISGHFPHRQRRAGERFLGTARIAQPCSAFFLFSLCRLLPYGLSVVSLPVGEPLADNSFNGASGSLYVIYAQTHAIGIPEIE